MKYGPDVIKPKVVKPLTYKADNSSSDPKKFIGGLGVILMMVAIVSIVVIIVVVNLDSSTYGSDVDDFRITDYSSDRFCGLSNDEVNSDSIVVSYYDGVSWSSVSTSNYHVVGDNVIVSSSVFT